MGLFSQYAQDNNLVEGWWVLGAGLVFSCASYVSTSKSPKGDLFC